jgi:hypothetical protein
MTTRAFEIRVRNGDWAEADDLGGALLAAKTLCEEAAPFYGGARLLRADVIVARNGQYDGPATEKARRGALR